MFTGLVGGSNAVPTIGEKMKKILLLLMLFAPYSLAQEIVKKDGKVFLQLDEQTAKDCEKWGCYLIPAPAMEQIIRESAKYMCGKSV